MKGIQAAEDDGEKSESEGDDEEDEGWNND
jgi:hypothetical protein